MKSSKELIKEEPRLYIYPKNVEQKIFFFSLCNVGTNYTMDTLMEVLENTSLICDVAYVWVLDTNFKKFPSLKN